MGRATQGVTVMKMREGHKLASIARVIDSTPGKDDQEELELSETIGDDAGEGGGDIGPGAHGGELLTDVSLNGRH